MSWNKTIINLLSASFLFGNSTVLTAQSNSLRFPNFPATLEQAEFRGQKGCVTTGNDSEFVVGAIYMNEGLRPVRSIRFMQTVEDGAHAVGMSYSKDKDYAYITADKADGKECITEKLYNLTFQSMGNYSPILIDMNEKYTPKQCDFTNRYGQICGTYKQVSGVLEKNGFAIDWQGVKSDENILTLLSGNGKSYYLTTNKETGATVVTGTGRYEF